MAIDWSELGPPLIITFAALAGGAVYGCLQRKQGARLAVAAGANVACALQTLFFMGPHTVATVAGRIMGKTKPMSLISVNILGVAYDFRLYALALVGILFLMQSYAMLRRARAVALGNAEAFARTRRASWNVILLALPLYPISPGIPFLTVPALASLLSRVHVSARARNSNIARSAFAR